MIYNRPLKYNTETFIIKAKEIHNNKYNYSKVIYTGISNKIIIICLKQDHGEFTQKPSNHITSKQGCPKCAKVAKLNNDVFIKRANEIHKDLYDYSNVNYINFITPVLIFCKKDNHGIFSQTPSLHLHQKHGCPKCNGGISYTQKDFIRKANEIHKNLYDYSNVIYVGSYVKITINCKKHGPFNQDPHTHLKGHGCPTCSHTTSVGEMLWLDILKIPLIFRKKSIKIGNILFKPDGLDIDNKIIYEFYGDYWHGNPKLYKQNEINPEAHKTYGELYENTLQKENYLISAGYKIISIWESDFIKQYGKYNRIKMDNI